MIRVNRRAVVPPPALTGDGCLGELETNRARAHFSSGSGSAFEHKAYKSEDVKAALDSLFHGKCAYCESFYAATAPVDVEHFRPKAGVEGAAEHPGYWWVAADWENLLPSCIDCNRRRKQITAHENMSLAEIEAQRAQPSKSGSGKKNAFPVRGPRCMPEDKNFAREDELLIDPTRRDPASHILFTTDSLDISLAVPVDVAGKASIGVFGLNRLGLVQARTYLLHRLRLLDLRINTALEHSEASDSDAQRTLWNDAARAAYEETAALAEPHQPYSALASTYLEKMIERIERSSGGEHVRAHLRSGTAPA